MTPEQLSLALGIASPSPVQPLCPDWQGMSDYQLFVKRDELIHPIISGNKWRKLKYALSEALQQQHKQIISFGGGYSNHLHALGYCCQRLGLRFTALVRGDYSKDPSPMLQDLAHWQCQIQYLDRSTYQRRDEADYLQQLTHQYPDALIIPEGGSQHQALTGVSEIIAELEQSYDYILAPVASGGTLAGLINALEKTGSQSKVIGVGVLKGKGYLERLVTNFLTPLQNSHWHINHDFHCGGYGKTPPELKEFCEGFNGQGLLRIEPVYSGKLFFAAKSLIETGYFSKGSRILLLHTGGLQGAR